MSLDSKKGLSPCLSVLGTASHVGKSVVVTALCRIFSDLGFKVSPFKAQNMSNNSFVTLKGEEIGRAQVVQAEAARSVIDVDMNPVLLKPSGDKMAQVVLLGKPFGNRDVKGYFSQTDFLFEQARSGIQRLRARYDLVIMEGAGSCAEVNLRDRDFVNFRMAHEVDAPVIIVSDIDRGGVFAQLIGTMEVLSPEDRSRVKGFIINRFRGDPELFKDGIRYIENKTGISVLGLIPYYYHIEIDCEDGFPLETLLDPSMGPHPHKINVAVIRLPRISNFTDFFPLARESSVCLHYLHRVRSLEGYDVVFLPGSKNVRADMRWLRECGWEYQIKDYLEKGGKIVGICGGYQMLGRVIKDPYGVEGDKGETKGLGLLDVETVLGKEKILSRSSGIWIDWGVSVEGYEIHMGTTSVGSDHPVIRIMGRSATLEGSFDGAMNSYGNVWGTYFHGIFDKPDFRELFLKELGVKRSLLNLSFSKESEATFRDRQYDLLAEHFRSHLDMKRLMEIIGI